MNRLQRITFCVLPLISFRKHNCLRSRAPVLHCWVFSGKESNIFRIKFNDLTEDKIYIISNGHLSYYYDTTTNKFNLKIGNNAVSSNEYQIENRIDEYEYLFFLIKLAIPKRIEFTRNTYLDCYNISKYIVYLRKIASLVQKYSEKYEKVWLL